MSHSQNASKNQTSVPNHASNSSLLEKTCDLIKNFPEYFDVVVSVARKTDGRHWTDLFSAAGRSTEYVVALFSFFIYNMNITTRHYLKDGENNFIYVVK